MVRFKCILRNFVFFFFYKFYNVFFFPGNHETYCKLYEFNANENKFILKQNIKSYGAIDIKHFHINDGSVNEHYLIVANTKFEGSKSMAVIFHFDHGKFVPVQVLDFETAITQFLPVVVSKQGSCLFQKFFLFMQFLIFFLEQTENKEFVLLIASQHAPIQSYQFDSWKFVKTSVSFTGGAFGRGVSRMRTHKINDEFLVLGETICFFFFWKRIFYLLDTNYTFVISF